MGSGIFFPICALPIILIIICIFNIKEHVKSEETKLYNLLVFTNLLGLIIEIICAYACRIFDKHFIISSFILKSYLVYLIIWTAIFTIYIFRVSNPKTTKIFKYIHLSVLLIIIAVIYALPIEVIAKNNFQIHYTVGASVSFSYLISFVYVLAILLIMLKNIKNLKNKKYLPVFLFFVIGTVSIAIQKTYPQFLLLTYSETLICLCMYFTIENPDVQMIRQLEYAKNAAEKANRAKTDFLSSMSHEIRTPLNAIVGLSEVIKTSDDIDEIHEDANDVVMASQNLLEIVNGILDISKIEADKMEIVEISYNPVEVFNELKKLTEIRIGEKEIELRCNFAPDIPNTLYGDRGKIKQIITNILTNAVKYTEKGYIDFNVNCINEKDNCRLQITISDTGRGIKESQMSTLFNKFERLEEDRNTTIEGTGLGLAITKSLTEMMGGKIVVHSTYGEGSKFTVLISQKIQTGQLQQNQELQEENISFDGKRVLVVDDNKLNLKVATKLLKEFNLEIITVESGFACLEKIENKENYDLILMDIMMPKMSGVETLKKLKQLEHFNIPVVALTADAMQGKSNKYIEVGFNDYLAKPIDKEELRKVLSKLLTENEENTLQEDSDIHKVMQITDEDIEILNKKLKELD